LLRRLPRPGAGRLGNVATKTRKTGQEKSSGEREVKVEGDIHVVPGVVGRETWEVIGAEEGALSGIVHGAIAARLGKVTVVLARRAARTAGSMVFCIQFWLMLRRTASTYQA